MLHSPTYWIHIGKCVNTYLNTVSFWDVCLYISQYESNGWESGSICPWEQKKLYLVSSPLSHLVHSPDTLSGCWNRSSTMPTCSAHSDIRYSCTCNEAPCSRAGICIEEMVCPILELREEKLTIVKVLEEEKIDDGLDVVPIDAGLVEAAGVVYFLF